MLFPDVSVRQWVLTLPFPLRLRLAWDGDLRRAVHRVFRDVVYRWYREHAREDGVPDGRCGSVTFFQNFGSALNLNVHLHSLVADGVFFRDDDGEVRFHAAHPVSTDEVQELVDTIATRVERLLRRRGLLDNEEEHDEDDDDGQRLMMAASVAGRTALGSRAGRKPRCLRGPPGRPYVMPPRCASSGFFNLHAGVRAAARDRLGRERLFRYVARPPLASERLVRIDDHRVVVTFKRAWSDGTTGVILTGIELLERLAALVPRPRAHLLVYGGVFAPGSSWRREVVPDPPDNERRPLRKNGCDHPKPVKPPTWIPWRDLMIRVFSVDPQRCGCGQVMRVHAVVQLYWATKRVLACLGLPSVAPSRAQARAPPEELF